MSQVYISLNKGKQIYKVIPFQAQWQRFQRKIKWKETAEQERTVEYRGEQEKGKKEEGEVTRNVKRHDLDLLVSPT